MLIFLITILIFVIIILSIWTWYNPESILIPLNLLYNLDPSPRTNFYTDEERDSIFPVGSKLEAIWQEIRQEGYQLYETLPDKDINYLDNYHMNIGEENKRNWTTIPLRLFGRDSNYYMEQCPNLRSILQEHPEIKSCLFSIMEPGKIIRPHVGPYDGLLRYQLALDIPKINSLEIYHTAECDKSKSSIDAFPICFDSPPDMPKDYTANDKSKSSIDAFPICFDSPPDKSKSSIDAFPICFDSPPDKSKSSIDAFPICFDSPPDMPKDYTANDKSKSIEECYLHVGGERYEWTEGKGVLFDEANLHGAINTTTQKRMVLLIDLERPYSLSLYRIINKAIIWGMGTLPGTKQSTLI